MVEEARVPGVPEENHGPLNVIKGKTKHSTQPEQLLNTIKKIVDTVATFLI